MNGCELIAAERRRQVEFEGWSAEHDAGHDNGELAVAAAELAVDGTCAVVREHEDEDNWGLVHMHGHRGIKPDQVRALTIAGALIAAEIDRVQAAAPPEPVAEGEETK